MINSMSTASPLYQYDGSEEEEATQLEIEAEQEPQGVGGVLEKRKRSSRACDQCRKTKSKCQRTPSSTTCRNCLAMNQECTYLGPNRKRGPPKGYITQLENRVHRLEALLGSLLSSHDSRAQTLIADISQDSLGRDIIKDVEFGPFGPVGRAKVMQSHMEESMKRAAAEANGMWEPQVQTQGIGQKTFVSSRDRREQLILGNETDSFLPSYPWQDRMIHHLNAHGIARLRGGALKPHAEETDPLASASYSFFDTPTHQTQPQSQSQSRAQPQNVNTLISKPDGTRSHSRSHRNSTYTTSLAHPLTFPSTLTLGPHSLASKRPYDAEMIWRTLYERNVPSSGEEESEYESEGHGEDEGWGVLSLNEKMEVGYLGKTSGMHLLAKPPRSDGLNHGGIWHLPQSRIWPASHRGRPMTEEDLPLDFREIPLPPIAVQREMLELYWTYVQPIVPVLDREKFMEEWENDHSLHDLTFDPHTRRSTTSKVKTPSTTVTSPATPALPHTYPYSPSDPQSFRPLPSATSTTNALTSTHRVPRLLLLSMFTIVARYAKDRVEVRDPLKRERGAGAEPGVMWEAGCEYLDWAKMILNWTYDSSRPSTVQSLILLAYREFGIGAISQAWLYMGMAIRMATDLGMHRSADRWQRHGHILFTPSEKSSRKRIWHCAVILDRIMAFATGRPMCIRERDYDTALPDKEEGEDREAWPTVALPGVRPQPVHTLSTLDAMASLSSILALVVDTIYACRSGVSFVLRHIESFKIAKLLDEWYDTAILPHLHVNTRRYDQEYPPLPHILTLHMMYWVVVLLVHRPFIRHFNHHLAHTPVTEEEISRMSEKSFEHSAYAASKVSELVELYRRTWDLSRASAFVGWFALSAGIMHVAILTMRKGNQEQARLGLQRCLDAFEEMKIVWPSSERAWQLLHGAKVDLSLPPHPSDIQDMRPPPDLLTPHDIEMKNHILNGSRSSTINSYSQVHPSAPFPIGAHSSQAQTRGNYSYPSLTMALGKETSGPPPDLSYFPGYNYWPPESLVFDPPFLNFNPYAEEEKPSLAAPLDTSGTSRGRMASTATSTSANTTPLSVPDNAFSEALEEYSNVVGGYGGGAKQQDHVSTQQQHSGLSAPQQHPITPWDYYSQNAG